MNSNILAAITALSKKEVGNPRLIFRQKLHGLPISILYCLAKIAILSRVPVKGSSLLYCFLLNIMTELLLSTLKVANVHIIIYKLDHSRTQIPSLVRYIFSLSIWLRTFPAALLYSICSSVCFYLPLYVGRFMLLQIGRDGRVNYGRELGKIAALNAALYLGRWYLLMLFLLEWLALRCCCKETRSMGWMKISVSMEHGKASLGQVEFGSSSCLPKSWRWKWVWDSRCFHLLISSVILRYTAM